jgi:DNA topoisomerase II
MYNRIFCRIEKKTSCKFRFSSSKSNRSIEEMYQRKTPVEHVLLRPGMYIGSVVRQKADTSSSWIFDFEKQRMIKQQKLYYCPGLLKLFDEILVNACDNKQRDPTMSRLEVTIDNDDDGFNEKKPFTISILNDGKGIPVVLHAKEKVYVPDLIFGTLLTGSNFSSTSNTKRNTDSSSTLQEVGGSNNELSMTGGQHGYGAKLTNIFSSEFIVETADCERGLFYKQIWRNNMMERSEPIISPLKSSIKRDFTRITFKPDLKRFDDAKMVDIGVDMGTVALMKRRVVDSCGTLGNNNISSVKVLLNGKEINATTFEEYCALYMPIPTIRLDNSQHSLSVSTKTISDSTPTLIEEGNIKGTKTGAAVSEMASGLNPKDAANNLSLMNYLRVNKRLEIVLSPAGFRISGSGTSRKEIVIEDTSDSSFLNSKKTLKKTLSKDETLFTATDLESYNTPGSVSFMNSMHTPRGGTHVNIVLEAVSRQLSEHIIRRVKALKRGDDEGLLRVVRHHLGSGFTGSDLDIDAFSVTPALVRQHLRLYVNARMEGPSFDSQSKEQLVSAPEAVVAALGGKPVDSNASVGWLELPDKWIRQVADQPGGISDAVFGGLLVRAGADLARSLKKATRGGSDAKIRSIPKLEDANYAGSTRRAHECTLIVTEGDSAKALAVAGLAVVGRDYYGVFPLRGKLLNVRDVSVKAALENAEVAALVAILGLDFKKSYTGLAPVDRGLRYGRVMIMADQDVDGSHIKGLLVNLFHTYWPQLLSSVGEGTSFLEQFITPIIKAKQGEKNIREFFSIRDFETWRKGGSVANTTCSTPMVTTKTSLSTTKGKKKVSIDTSTNQGENNDKYKLTEPGEALRGRWTIKYYKGLGTSTSTEGRTYFSSLQRHRKPFVWGSSLDGSVIDMAFNKDRVEDRKAWISSSSAFGSVTSTTTPLSNPVQPSFVEFESVSFSDFINRELIEFSLADLIRSIPSVLDGLKPSQRKVLWACFKRAGTARSGKSLSSATDDEATDEPNETGLGVSTTSLKTSTITNHETILSTISASSASVGSEIKVAQLAGYVAEHTAYHHGEASLTATIVAMAQDFVGSNNLNLLQPLGQFGTRLQGGKDAASARYIFTKLSPLARLLFPASDDDLLVRRDDDGQLVEPVTFLPVIPLVLVNGASGIGTGWSTGVPMYNPLQITEAVSAALDRGWHIATPSQEKEPPFELLPWWRGFRGEIDTRAGDDGYVTHGIASIEDSELNEGSGVTIRIRELPIGRWTEDYKVFLQGLVNENLLKSFREYHTESSVDFVLQLAPEAIDKLALNGGAWASPRIQDSLRRFFKLSSPLSTRNMHLFDVYGKIRRYTSPWGIIQDFMIPRGAAYAARRIKLEGFYSEQLLRAQARARFLSDVVSGLLVVNRRPRADIEAELWNRGFPTSSSFGGSKDFDESSTTSNVNFNTSTGTITPVVPNSLSHLLDTTLLSRYSTASKLSLKVTDAPRTQQQHSSSSSSLPKSAFDYLLTLPLSQLTFESLQRTKKLAQDTEIALATVRSTSPETMWKNDLLALSTALSTSLKD